LRRSIGRYFFEQQTNGHPDQARLEKGTLGAADTTWQVFWSSRPAGCASNNPYTLLARPILSVRQIDRWPGLSATVADASDSIWTVIAADTFLNATDSSLLPATFSYTVEKRSGLITGLNVSSSYQLHLASFFYDRSGPIPMLSRITLSTADTSVAAGGYVFSNIRINDTLSDSLFVVGTRNPLIRYGFIGMPTVGGSPVLAFDPLGRMIPPAAERFRRAAGLRVFGQPLSGSTGSASTQIRRQIIE
jgi:hypothetical protein